MAHPQYQHVTVFVDRVDDNVRYVRMAANGLRNFEALSSCSRIIGQKAENPVELGVVAVSLSAAEDLTPCR